MNLTERLKTKMAACAMSQYALAKISGVPQPTIHRILLGQSLEPRRSTLDKLAQALQLDKEWLATGEDIMEENCSAFNATKWQAMPPKARALIEEIILRTEENLLSDDDLKIIANLAAHLTKTK